MLVKLEEVKVSYILHTRGIGGERFVGGRGECVHVKM
jgi:hypothetical protein